MSLSPVKAELLRQLRCRIGTSNEEDRPLQLLSVNNRSLLLDQFLPVDSSRKGLLIEWLSDYGTGAATLAFLSAREEQSRGRAVVVIDHGGEFYPPAAAALGLDVAKLAVVRPQSHGEKLWAWEQALRAEGVTVVGRLERVPASALRRLKLAAEHGGGLGLLLRPHELQSTASWADLRLAVIPIGTASLDSIFLSRRVRVEALYVRGGFDRRSLLVDITDETASLSLVSELADPKPAGVRTRAS